MLLRRTARLGAALWRRSSSLSTLSAQQLAEKVTLARSSHELKDRLALTAELSAKWVVNANVCPEGANFEFTLSYPHEEGASDGESAVAPAATLLGVVKAFKKGTTAYVFGAGCEPALPLADAGKPLVAAAVAELRARGAAEVRGWARLPGLCKWLVDTEAWQLVDGDMVRELAAKGLLADGEKADFAVLAACVEAMAKGQPRHGHAVLGHGTFAAAEPAWVALAADYAQFQSYDPTTEVALFKASGAALTKVQYMHDKSPDALRDNAGCTLAFVMETSPGL